MGGVSVCVCMSVLRTHSCHWPRVLPRARYHSTYSRFLGVCVCVCACVCARARVCACVCACDHTHSTPPHALDDEHTDTAQTTRHKAANKLAMHNNSVVNKSGSNRY